ncbi:MAG: hypothetical protein BAJATHORv1_80007 [Candidatus Thorarchaeota archaeon]|nr:MAG: hypothetical protein BAJATHORv1_80007 [Candidatus Thorarchaeota archaeon]
MGLEKKIGEIVIEIQQGDITVFDVDAIVNAANSALWMGSGVAGAIKSKGGTEIEAEAMAKGPIIPGQAVITTAGRLPARYVIHCAGMPPGESAQTEYVNSSAVRALELASDKRLESIAFPAIGSGVGGLTHKQSAEAIIKAIIEYAEQSSSIKRVILVGYGEKATSSFAEALQSLV